MITLSDYAITEKNKVSSSNAWIHLIEITWPAASLIPVYRATDNNEDVIFDGETWESKPLVVGDINEDLDEVPQCSIQIENISQEVESNVLDHAYFEKTDGICPITVKIMVVNSGNLSAAAPETTHEYELIDATSDNTWIVLTCGVTSPFRKRFPAYVIRKDHCQVPVFKGIDCGYVGVGTTCNRTIEQCRLYGNQSRFLAFPGTGDELYNE